MLGFIEFDYWGETSEKGLFKVGKAYLVPEIITSIQKAIETVANKGKDMWLMDTKMARWLITGGTKDKIIKMIGLLKTEEI